ncbi:acyl-CoA dehydrogenase [Spongiactinospora gelatinilytica]|uniref:Acyl-CoA dehydrogenase n=1 Tax=Spongiactinospora gelatinilytica TaxID=2666298 RepID=A0A2W2HCX3_9ACTN|nr:acyl-CoA dehydrogenase family protein [Spongiactinospora gelatinilytica]PZG47438.1 acyl-CoA dehydrogenase [Spongiactinospora gelatinilytica]
MRAGVHSLTDVQNKILQSHRRFAEDEIAPHANAWDREGRVPREVVAAMGAAGHLGALIPAEYGGTELDMTEFGLLNEAIGFGCSSVRSVLTVHSMVSQAVTRWGNPEQRRAWLPGLATGEQVGAFALSEAEAGSDVAQITTVAENDGDGYLLSGTKRWITYGQGADVFLVFARHNGRHSAFVAGRDTPGLTVVPIDGMLGTRASMLAEVRFDNCRVPRSALLGRPGFGLAPIAAAALDVGRYSVAWGSVGLAQSCLELSLGHARERRAFGGPVFDHQLVQRLITDMATGVSAARLLCLQAGELVQGGAPTAVAAVWMAKYFASTSAFRAASDTVQIHGAYGCDPDGSPQRLFRDAKVMEIIEGSTQIQQTMIARLVPYEEKRP